MIGLLTILGFSLYDTVVVFDKVKENTRGLLGLTRRTYAEAANLALNQTLMRSINTSLIAVLPVVGLMVIGVGLLGVGTLADLALVQMVGILVGALSSLLLATPLLVDLKMRDRRYAEQAARVTSRRAAGRDRGRARRTGRRRAAGARTPSRTWPTTTCWPASCAGSGRWPRRPAPRRARARPRRARRAAAARQGGAARPASDTGERRRRTGPGTGMDGSPSTRRPIRGWRGRPA